MSFSNGGKKKVLHALHANDHLNNVELSMKPEQITSDYLSFS